MFDGCAVDINILFVFILCILVDVVVSFFGGKVVSWISILKLGSCI